MATPRKGPKVSPPSTETARKRWPTEDGDDSLRNRDANDLVSVVRGLAAAVAEHGLSELVVDTPDATFTLRRGGAAQVTMPSMAAMPAMGMPTMAMPSMPMQMMSHAAPSGVPPQFHHAPAAPAPTAAAPAAAAAEPDDKGHLVTSPFVGTFYRRPNPDSPEYAKVNDRVKKGQVLCIVEAMKLMNEIEADIDGTILAILAEDGAPVEYGQPLFKIAP